MLTGFAAAALIVAGAHAADPAPAALRLSVAVGPALPLGRAAQRFAEGIAERSAGRLAVKLYPGATLAHRDPSVELHALMTGAADLAVGSALQWSTQVPALAVFALPWIAPRPEDLARLALDGALQTALAGALAARGVVLVAVAPLGHRDIATRARPVREPADLARVRVRTLAHPMVQALYLTLGALPQSLRGGGADAALAEGALDGQDGLSTTLALARVDALGARFVSDWGAIGDAMLFAVAQRTWDGWSEGERDAARAAAMQASDDARALQHESDARAVLARAGLQLVRLTPAGHAMFRRAADPVWAQWREAIGADVVALAEIAVARAPTGSASQPASPDAKSSDAASAPIREPRP